MIIQKWIIMNGLKLGNQSKSEKWREKTFCSQIIWIWIIVFYTANFTLSFSLSILIGNNVLQACSDIVVIEVCVGDGGIKMIMEFKPFLDIESILWNLNPRVPCWKPLCGSNTTSYLSAVDQVSTTNSWGLSGKNCLHLLTLQPWTNWTTSLERGQKV